MLLVARRTAWMRIPLGEILNMNYATSVKLVSGVQAAI